MKKAVLLMMLALGALISGCKSAHEETMFDQLWRQGYGFNNPNPDRMRKGLPPVDFDGQVRHRR